MSQFEDFYFYKYAMDLFSDTGHNCAANPVFINHSSEQFVFFDNQSNMLFSRKQLMMFRMFNCVTNLFSFNDCIFFSINLLTGRDDRSQVAHDIHMMIHPIVGAEGTICLFHYNDEVMLSFMGFGYCCILSDWYPMDDDFNCLSNRLHISNMSLKTSVEYFEDMIYSLARSYYLKGQLYRYDLFPIDFILNLNAGADGADGADRDEIERYIEREMKVALTVYGNDYVEYEKTLVNKEDSGNQIDLMLLELENIDDNLIDEEMEAEENSKDDVNDTVYDKYEYDDVDPEIFKDPVLMVKWINKND